ncbi:MAG: hypothetical protein NTW19_07235 [Planctomycetota bacterium]|nr:hypothetical protein [Planctomycetota bacterium]
MSQLQGTRPLATRARRLAPLLGVAALWLSCMASAAFGRTVIVNDVDAVDRMACLCADAPRQSWACIEVAPGVFDSSNLDLHVSRSFLFRFDLGMIPKGQRITRAELILPVNYIWVRDSRMYVWRVLPEWGPGACWLYRNAQGKPVEWAQPGGRGNAADRATRPTAIVTMSAPAETIINVTRDLELWYTGAAPNNGWMLSVEDTDVTVRLASPVWSGRGTWKLRITYEPE